MEEYEFQIAQEALGVLEEVRIINYKHHTLKNLACDHSTALFWIKFLFFFKLSVVLFRSPYQVSDYDSVKLLKLTVFW